MSTEMNRGVVENGIDTLIEKNPQSTDGKWLELLTVKVAPHIREWDIETAYEWGRLAGAPTPVPGRWRPRYRDRCSG